MSEAPVEYGPPPTLEAVRHLTRFIMFLSVVAAGLAAGVLPLGLGITAVILLMVQLLGLTETDAYLTALIQLEPRVAPSGVWHVGITPRNPSIGDMWFDGLTERIYIGHGQWRETK
jgi:hypothetical protein